MWVDQQFHLHDDVVKDLQGLQVPWGGGLLSAATFYRTYSRDATSSPFGRQEHFADVVWRNVEGVFSIRKSWYKLIGRRWDEEHMQQKAAEMALAMFHMKFLPPGRSLFAMGTRYIFERGNAALNNCGFVEVGNNDTDMSDAAAWLMDQLMLGVGVGFKIPLHGQGWMMQKPHASERVYRIPDTREGWVESVRLLIESYELGVDNERKPDVHFNYDDVRPAGAPIRSFGGTASGPGPLKELHKTVRRLMDAKCDEGDWFGTFDTELVADIMNLIGVCVIAGNVRRSAEIAIGSSADEVFVNLKNFGEWDNTNKTWKTIGPYNHRAGWGYMSNNSVWLDSDADFERIPDLTEILLQRGEPGFINGANIRNRGRYIDKVGNGNPWLRPDYATGMNPCGEIPLESHELCNLVEVFPTRCTSQKEFNEVLQHATFFASTVALLPSHDPDTNDVVARNRRIGVSVSGVADWIDSAPFSRIHRWLDDGYDVVRHTNTKLAADAGVPPSIRLTTIKPSGTVSLLPWVSPGMHHPIKNRFIRRITFRQDDPATERLIQAGVPYEPLATDPTGSYSFQFPMESANKGKTRSVENVPISEQVAIAQFLAQRWADNAVSFTGTVAKREIPYLERVITMALPTVKSMSFMLNQEDEQQHDQLPYEAISVDEFNRRKAQITEDVDWSNYGGSDGLDSRYCDGDVCVI